MEQFHVLVSSISFHFFLFSSSSTLNLTWRKSQHASKGIARNARRTEFDRNFHSDSNHRKKECSVINASKVSNSMIQKDFIARIAHLEEVVPRA